ncbi:nuclear transport factor 2 family protein [soil metagenome]
MADPALEKLMHANLFEVFGERDPGKRMEAIRRTYTEDVIFADPDGEVQGYDALSAKVDEILGGASGLIFQAEGEVYKVQDLGYLAWSLGPEGEPPVARGADMAIVRDGLIAKVYTVLFA